jgi:hypothetical protein
MKVRGIVAADRGGNAALGPGGRDAAAERRGTQDDGGARREIERH